MTPIGNYYDNAQALLKNARPVSPQGGVFVKLNDSYIYMQKLNPSDASAEKVKVYDFKDGKLVQVTEEKAAKFANGAWSFEQPKAYLLDDVRAVQAKSSVVLSQLQGVDPNILANITGSKLGLNLTDSLRAIWIFKDQSLNLDKLKNSISATILIPFFAPAFVVFALAFAPAGGRFLSLSTYSAAMIVTALFLWGGLLALSKYLAAANSMAQLFLLFAVCSIFFVSAYFYRFKMERI
jgi:lipopolysaccharide export system permease protein